MTINGVTYSWVALSQFYGNGSIQGQSNTNQTTSTDYSSRLQQATDSLMSALDTNKDGTIDKAEFSQAIQALSNITDKTYNDADSVFNSIDSNNDGVISADELMKALQQAQGNAHHHHHHHHHKIAATNTSAQSDATTNPTQTSNISEETSSLSKMQLALLQKIMTTYNTNSTNSTTSDTNTFATTA